MPRFLAFAFFVALSAALMLAVAHDEASTPAPVEVVR